MAASARTPDATVRHKTDRVRFIHGKNRIGRYELMFSLDMGGMAAVYAGRLAGPAGFEKLVALKIIYPHLAAEDAFINMFFDEARIVAGIRHPNVAEIYEVGQDDGVYFMAMELVDGQSLHAMARKVHEVGAKVPAELYADLVAKVCRGAHDAHELCDADGRPLNLVHRDISPRNVLVSYKGAVKLIDFGVAYAAERLTHTQDGAAKGKVGYMPPEYIRGQVPDRRSDIFALGVVLYNMLTAAHPYPGRTEGERIDNILNGRVVPPSELLPEISPQLEAIVLRAIHTDSAQRYSTALEMAEALERYVHSVGFHGGQQKLEALMEQLFAEEAQELQRKIRKFRKRHPKAWDTPSTGTPTGTGSIQTHEDITEQLTDSEVMFAEHGTLLERVEELPRFSKSRKRSWWMMGAAASLVVAVSAFLLSRPTPSVQVPATRFQPEEQKVERPAVEPSKPEAPLDVSPQTESGPAPQISPTVRIRFDLADAEVTVALDGVSLARSAREVVLRRDGTTHTLEFAKAGHFPHRVTFEANEDRSIVVDLERMPSRQKNADKASVKGNVKMLNNPFD